MGKVKIQDIANELSLSRNTVAKALSNNGVVAEDTRKQIVEKAIEMGYTKLPQEILEKHKKDNDGLKAIYILTRRDLSPFWSMIIMGINNELSATGYNVNFCFANEEIESDANMLINMSTDVKGIIVLNVFSDVFIEKFVASNVPIVFLDIGLNNQFDNDKSVIKGDVILSEGTYAVGKITKGLICQGLRKIGFIGDTTYCKTIKDRYEGYISALKEAGITPDKSIIFKEHRTYRYYLKEEIEELVASLGYLPDAIVCANDEIALTLIQCLKARGIQVPDDIAVTGYDDLESLIEQLDPFLTTIKVKHLELGKRLARQLMWRMDNLESSKEIIMVLGEVILRESSNKRGIPKDG